MGGGWGFWHQVREAGRGGWKMGGREGELVAGERRCAGTVFECGGRWAAAEHFRPMLEVGGHGCKAALACMLKVDGEQ